MSLYVDLAGKGELEGVANFPDILEHREKVGIYVGEHYKIKVGAVVLVIIFNIECGEVNLVFAENFPIRGYVADDAVDREVQDF